MSLSRTIRGVLAIVELNLGWLTQYNIDHDNFHAMLCQQYITSIPGWCGEVVLGIVLILRKAWPHKQYGHQLDYVLAVIW